ncbi:MAG TPA: SRPBCC domain-containing protein [Candidatus Saccharimonadales bacterium]|nr:SRPBCC domain-containing protein [Candidatus Saccharimonadales bacterium]
MKEIHTEINIQATAERVWKILTDFKNFQQWNPFIYKIDGDPSVGTRIKIHLRTPNGKNRRYQPKITMVEPSRELRWLGKLTIPGIFDGERIFILEPIGDKQIRFVHKEIFAGLLVHLVGNRLDKDMYSSFISMNEALKKRAEE